MAAMKDVRAGVIFLILAACSSNHSDAMDPSLGNQSSIGPTTTSTATARTSTAPSPLSSERVAEDVPIVETTTAPTSPSVTVAPVPLPAFDIEPCSSIEPIVGTVPGNLGHFQNADPDQRTQIRRYTTQYPETFAGSWTDRTQGTVIVAFTDDVEGHRTRLGEILGPNPVDVVEVVDAEYSALLLNNTPGLLFQNPRKGFLGGGVDHVRNRVRISLDELNVDELAATLADLPSHVCYWAPDPPPPGLAKSPDEELRPVNVVVQPPVVLTSRTLTLDLTEQECAAGQAMGDRLRAPVVKETAESIYVAFWVAKQPGQLCRERHVTTVTLELNAPVGTRSVIGSGGWTLLDTPAGRDAALFVDLVWMASIRLEAIGLHQLERTAATRTSETFLVGTDARPLFEITLMLNQTEPHDGYRDPGGTDGGHSRIERDQGGGWWTACGDRTYEVLSLTGDVDAALDVLRAATGENGTDLRGTIVETLPSGSEACDQTG